MKKLILIAMLITLSVRAALVPITLAWDPQGGVDLFKLYGTNDVTAPLTTWPLVGSSTTNVITFTVSPGRLFYYVTASNF